MPCNLARRLPPPASVKVCRIGIPRLKNLVGGCERKLMPTSHTRYMLWRTFDASCHQSNYNFWAPFSRKPVKANILLTFCIDPGFNCNPEPVVSLPAHQILNYSACFVQKSMTRSIPLTSTVRPESACMTEPSDPPSFCILRSFIRKSVFERTF